MSRGSDITSHIGIRDAETTIPADLEGGSWRISDALSVRVSWLDSALRWHTRALLAETCGLTLLEWRCVATLYSHGARTNSEVAHLCSVVPSQISRALRGLRDRGLVAWSAGSSKRGYGPVALTADGARLYETASPIFRLRNRWLLDGLPDDDWRGAYALVAHLRQRVSQAPDTAALLEWDESRSSDTGDDWERKRPCRT